jgi:hypothetical protein
MAGQTLYSSPGVPDLLAGQMSPVGWGVRPGIRRLYRPSLVVENMIWSVVVWLQVVKGIGGARVDHRIVMTKLDQETWIGK